MNIFAFDPDPWTCALWLDDVRKNMVRLECEDIGGFYWSLWSGKTRLYGTGNLGRILSKLNSPTTASTNQSYTGNYVAYGPILEWPVEAVGEPPEGL